MDKRYTHLSDIQRDAREGTLTIGALIEHYLQNIKAHNPKHNVFLNVFEDEARQSAAEIDQKLQKGTAGRLAGLVFGVKDVLCVTDKELSCGSQILNGFRSQFTSTAVQRLLDEDAILIGTQNCDEFAMGSSCENSSFGPVVNGAGENRVPGGSSGGSAVAVQMDMCHISLGSDTGGSVRQPAAFCGVYGLKPTYSRVSRHGLVAYASSFDIIGVLSNSVEDAALTLEVIAGADEYDATVSTEPVPAYSELPATDKKYRIGYIQEILESNSLEPAIKEASFSLIEKMKAEGHEVTPVSFNYLDYILPTYYILTTAEASSNLSRYDGVRYGYRSGNSKDLESMYKKSRTEGFGEEVLRRILLGTFVLSASYYDAYFTQAQKVRRIIQEKTLQMLEDCDFVLSPTTPTTAFALGENTQDPLQMYLADLYTVQASLAGVPAMSIPRGEDLDGMPIGIQLMTSAFNEVQLLSFSKEVADM
ncbi:MAG: Asp-tRNA(Asn)/Glu-tRNA(Gln) amidotransferase subunit GatA [Bacteroidota bacterium]